MSLRIRRKVEKFVNVSPTLRCEGCIENIAVKSEMRKGESVDG